MQRPQDGILPDDATSALRKAFEEMIHEVDWRALGMRLIPSAVLGLIDWKNVPDNGTIYELLFYGCRPPPFSIKSYADVQQVIEQRRTTLFGDHKLLNDIWRRHGATICKRWAKKSATQRLHVLQHAWDGSMSDTHRPDFVMFCVSRDNDDWHNHEAQRDAILLPSINTEDLQPKSKNLLAFMHSRAMHKFIEFAHMEHFIQICEPFFHLGLTNLEQPYYAMMFKRGVDDHEYGKLINMRKHAQAAKWYKNQDIMPVHRGVLLLEQQEKIWSFLIACARAIIHDLPGERILDALPCELAPLPPIDFHKSSWSETAELMPYSTPGTINLGRMVSLLRAKRDEELDHHFYLREDPVYLMDTAHLHPWSLKFTLMPARWKGCTSNIMWDSFVEQRAWTFMHTLAKELQYKYGNEPCADQFRDGNSHRDILSFFNVLRLHYEWRLQKLWRSCIVSPWYDFIFADRGEVDPSAGDTSSVAYRIATILRWVRFMAKLDRTAAEEVQLTMIIAEAQRLLDGNDSDLRFISSAIKENIAELATIAGPMNQLALFKDCYPDRTISDHLPSFQQWRSHLVEIVYPHAQYGPGPDYENAEFTKHCGKDPSFFPYPSQGSKNREKIGEMRRTESKLDLLWSHFDQYVKEHGLDQVQRNPVPSRPMRRTEPWLDPKLKSLDAKLSAQQPVQSLSDIYRDLRINTERTLKTDASFPAVVKIKLKTQGTSNQHRGSEENQNSDHYGAPAIQPIAPSDTTPASSFALRINVNARALKTFKILFFAPSPGSTPGEVPWKDFLYAMYSAGFRAEKMYGSAWKFDPVETSCADGTPPVAGQTAATTTTTTTTDAASTFPTDGPTSTARTSIIFHEPHPSNKIPYVIARRHGRRLARAYGWSGETFVLAEKEKIAPVSQKEKETEKETKKDEE